MKVFLSEGFGSACLSVMFMMLGVASADREVISPNERAQHYAERHIESFTWKYATVSEMMNENGRSMDERASDEETEDESR